MTHLTVQLIAQKLKNGKFKANFQIQTYCDGELNDTPYYLSGEYSTKEEAYKVAEIKAFEHIKHNYPEDTKFSLKKRL
ncbi:hypothetical protein KKD19_01580 [Patescibacteria group bacterium]|nr:hypothetical protein [Patescibacteria group bacterium]MBU4511921.1 hypothetical protein [Patescibacteria group bacterium]MCG2692889.1 hypothetical protein [Candidatus Parcubacteria bacterium]